jgi:hypothetical protein
VNPIRPNSPPIQPAQPQRTDAARAAAQRAFFDAARGGAPTPTAFQTTERPAATVRMAAAQPAPAPIRPRQPTATPTEAPTRILRPGSLLDIRV